MLKKLTTKDIALAITFTALYVVFGFLKISPIIGLPGQAITAAAIMAPLIGIILGPYVGTLCAVLGGVIGFFFGSFSQLSFFSGVATVLCSGLICEGRRVVAILAYLSLFLLLVFYPSVGPVWLFPVYMWFQIIGLIILVSPLQTAAMEYFASKNGSRLFFAFFITSLVSTLAGQIAGTLTLEIIHIPDANYFLGTWVATSLFYPVERTIIAMGAAFVGASLYKVLRSTSFMPLLNR
jgi:hypothetical protein